MSEISSTQPSGASAPWQQLDLRKENPDLPPAEEGKGLGGGLTADFNTFLKLLTTQLKSQDPLNPMENTEFIAQLASFSAVEQQVQGNKKLDTLIEKMSESSAGALSKWLDKDVRAPTRARYDGDPIAAYPPPPPAGTTTATLAVFDDDDQEISRISFDAGDESVIWDGTDQHGNAAPAGSYRFVAFYADKELNTSKLPAETYSRVTEARLVDGEPMLVLNGGSQIYAEEVTAVRSSGGG